MIDCYVVLDMETLALSDDAIITEASFGSNLSEFSSFSFKFNCNRAIGRKNADTMEFRIKTNPQSLVEFYSGESEDTYESFLLEFKQYLKSLEESTGKDVFVITRGTKDFAWLKHMCEVAQITYFLEYWQELDFRSVENFFNLSKAMREVGSTYLQENPDAILHDSHTDCRILCNQIEELKRLIG